MTTTPAGPLGPALRDHIRSAATVYRQAGQPVSVLGLEQMRLFTRWRRRLSRGD